MSGWCEDWLSEPQSLEATTEESVGFKSGTPFCDENHQRLLKEILSVGLEDTRNEEPEREEGETAGRKSDDSKYEYPLRPYAGDCLYYMKTGTCKYKLNCKFNHPVRRVNQGVKEIDKEVPAEHAASTECKYYLTPEGCKFGKACRYKHSMETSGIEAPELNFLGLPIRVGEKECPFYMRSGSCGYGAKCIFHHPDPTEVGESNPEYSDHNESKGTPSNSLENHTSRSNPLPDSASSQPLAAWAPHMMMRNTVILDNQSHAPPKICSSPKIEYLDHESNGYQTSFHPQEKSSQSSFVSSTSNCLENTDTLHHLQRVEVEELTEPPGQPESVYYMKTGYSNFKSACRYHHPKNQFSELPISAPNAKNQSLESLSLQENLWKVNVAPEGENISSKVDVSSYQLQQQFQVDEFPERPGQPACSFFIKTGNCKYRSACRYHHPKNLPYNLPISVNAENLIPKPFSMQENSWKLNVAPEGEHFSNKFEVSSYQQQELKVDEFPERPGQPECIYFIKTGDCKYRSACRYHHPKNLPPRLPIGSLNSENLSLEPFPCEAKSWQLDAALLGENLINKFDIASYQHQQLQVAEFPERPGQPECSYFMRTGDCKFKSSCRYHHPNNRPTELPIRVRSAENLSQKPFSLLENSWKIKAAPEGENLTNEFGVSLYQQQQPQDNEFPERPGQPECSYFMKTGDCKYRSTCRYHHPKGQVSLLSDCSLSDKGLPLRPGSKICRNYKQYGICKFGLGCLFDHPKDELLSSFVGSVLNNSSGNESANDGWGKMTNCGNETEVGTGWSL